MRRWRVALRAVIAIIGAFYLYDFVLDRAPHRFVVTSDDVVSEIHLTLRDSERARTKAMTGGPHRFSGSLNFADASGQIVVRFADGKELVCPIGYLTNGEREPHIVHIKDRTCTEIVSHV